MQGRAIRPAEVGELASMPARPELLAKLLFVLQGPMIQIVNVLSAAPRNLMSVLAQAEQKRAGIENQDIAKENQELAK